MKGKDQKYNRVGSGGLWSKQGRNGEFWYGGMDFTYNGLPVTTQIIVFKNHWKEKDSDKPDFTIFVDDAYPTPARPVRDPRPDPKPQVEGKDEDQIPF